MRKVLTAGLLAILTTTFSMAQTNEREIFSDELCDKHSTVFLQKCGLMAKTFKPHGKFLVWLFTFAKV